ncbi:glycoside hydrolase family 37 protein [Botryobasidium botryosum FD-172 SS1]|uniref:Trehalase n=1 Tax=Botryobasidium botryosum (strain FD-172 SS1) TaxID=930990 RepID=A0A067MJX1_BOTB1|nr:glycoside hydrolase family 37 protein [Botryobasidium botryosum FD-172 SS1]
MKTSSIPLLAILLADAHALPGLVPAWVPRNAAAAISAGTVTTSSPLATATATPTAVSTAVPSAPAATGQSLPSQAPLAPAQPWCPSLIFCNGPLLQTINIANVYPDSKTFVDKPTNGTSNATLAAFSQIDPTSSTFAAPSNNITYGQVINFVDTDFKGEGLELVPVTIASNISANGPLTHVTDPLVNAWVKIVDGYWSQLARNTDPNELCDGIKCESTLIPLNHTFVVPGGRFREQYYWDTYWIIEGLLQSEQYDMVKSSLSNFMDELATIGFIPNGGRKYYLNRSQPPLFMKMLYNYVNATGDLSVLERGLPLAEVELAWWATNRTIQITSPYSGQTYDVAHYAVVNTAPRPEGFLEDYLTANGADIETPFTDQQKEDLYADLASGAESGWDYSSRWVKEPFAGNTSYNLPALRTLNTRNTIPVCLNSILYDYRSLLANLYDLQGQSNKNETLTSSAATHRSKAAEIKSAILDLFWDAEKLAFYDFNATSSSRNTLFSTAHFYPFWVDIWPDEVTQSEEKAFGAFASVNLVMHRYNGTLPVTFLQTGLQWDAPNAWPPHQYIAMEALRRLPSQITTRPLSSFMNSSTESFDLIPANQLGLASSDLPPQPLESGGNATTDINTVSGGGIINGGPVNASALWSTTLAAELANRYIASVFCSWYATGGSIPEMLAQLSPELLNLTHSDPSSTGHMYEKFNMFDVDASGSGGEYTVQAGFGWTNGAVLWVASTFGDVLSAPQCPPLVVPSNTTASSPAARSYAMKKLRGL